MGGWRESAGRTRWAGPGAGPGPAALAVPPRARDLPPVRPRCRRLHYPPPTAPAPSAGRDAMRTPRRRERGRMDGAGASRCAPPPRMLGGGSVLPRARGLEGAVLPAPPAGPAVGVAHRPSPFSSSSSSSLSPLWMPQAELGAAGPLRDTVRRYPERWRSFFSFFIFLRFFSVALFSPFIFIFFKPF